MLNLSQLAATPKQLESGVIDLNPEDYRKVCDLSTFSEIPSKEEMASRAREISEIANSYFQDKALIGGALFFMKHLEKALQLKGVRSFYAFEDKGFVEV